MEYDQQPDGFTQLGLPEELLATLVQLGYEEPTPIQREAIPPMLEGRDLLGQAATGTGKTAAFALPLLTRLAARKRDDAPGGLVLVPTRELAIQVAEAIHRYGRSMDARVLPIYGGQPIGRQLGALKRGVDVVVATPGRALDHMRRGSLSLENIEVIVLDEADEMLDMGFAEDIEAILSQSPEERQTVLFSATMPPRIVALTRKYLRDAVTVQIAREIDRGELPRVRQVAYVVARPHKLAALGRILDAEEPTAAIVFCRTRTEVDELTEALNARGYRAEALHGGMSQEQRDRVMKKLRAGTAELLIATDVAARGLDVDILTHVINYDVPNATESYVHRIGRVGRAGREGVAITLAEPREHRLLRNLERAAGQKLEVARVPTVADLKARRLELMRANLRETLLQEDTERFRVVVEALAGEFDIMDIAMAALHMADAATGGSELEEEADIPEPPPMRERAPRGFDRGERGRGPRSSGARAPRRGGAGTGTRIYIGAGRNAGIRPQDLVGAIANEAGIRGSEIGAIEIADRFSLVEVSEAVVDDVIDALRGAKIKGKRTAVRRERFRGD